MEKNREDLIENLKIVLIYGKKNIDGLNKDGFVEKIYKDDEDTAHFFYMKEFLKNHFTDEKELQDIISKNDVNSIFYEIQKLGL